MANPRQPAPGPRYPVPLRHGRRLSTYLAESVSGIVLGLGFFLALMLLLQSLFPGGTGLGELVRSSGGQARGTAQLAFDETGGAMIAVLTSAEHKVQDRPASSVVWSTARSGITLGDRHAVQTQAGSSATITFDENTVIELGEKSVIVVRKPRTVFGSRKKRASVVFMDGVLKGRVGNGPNNVELEVVAAGATVRALGDAEQGAEIQIAVENETSAVSVQDGTVELNWGDQKVVVPKGHAVTFDETTGPSLPAALPTAPRPVSPAPGTHFEYRSVPPSVTFQWRAVDDTTEFQLQVARDEAFSELLFDDRVASTRLLHENLGAGTYYWRVTGRRGPLIAEPSPVSRFVVERDGVAPALDVVFPEGTVDGVSATIRGTTEPGCRIFVGETQVPTDAGGAFEFSLPVQDGYNFVVVQSVDPSGNTSFRNHTVLARSNRAEEKP